MLCVRFDILKFVDVVLVRIGSLTKQSAPEGVRALALLADFLEAAASLLVQRYRAIQFHRLGFAQREFR